MNQFLSPNVLHRICDFLDEANVEYRVVEHEPTTTSQDSARARNEPLEVGAKALLVKADETFHLIVLPAHQRMHSSSLKRFLGAKNLRFASSDELLGITGLVPGSVPPFGQPIFSLPLLADRNVGQAFGRVAFNAGSLTTSIIMSAHDWHRLAKPLLGHFAKDDIE